MCKWRGESVKDVYCFRHRWAGTVQELWSDEQSAEADATGPGEEEGRRETGHRREGVGDEDDQQCRQDLPQESARATHDFRIAQYIHQCGQVGRLPNPTRAHSLLRLQAAPWPQANAWNGHPTPQEVRERDFPHSNGIHFDMSLLKCVLLQDILTNVERKRWFFGENRL